MLKDQLIGQTISHYKILERLGAGGMGTVYKAEDTKLKRTVALKFLLAEITREPQAKARFVHEAQAASALDHPRIGTIYEINETEDGHMFIAMAYYEGVTLAQKIAAGPVSALEACEIVTHVAYGLMTAHSKGIVHRDIKPANIIITNDGFLKIVDFGLAKLGGATRITKEGTSMGTPAYMSPEQVKGLEVDHRSDIWSLGLILYELVTGKLPFRGDNEMTLLYNIVNEEPLPVGQFNTRVPLELETVIHKAIAKAPDDRYASMQEMYEDLNRIRQTLPQDDVQATKTIIAQDVPVSIPNIPAPDVTKTSYQPPVATRTVVRPQGTMVIPAAGSAKTKSSSKKLVLSLVVAAVLAAIGALTFSKLPFLSKESTTTRDPSLEQEKQPATFLPSPVGSISVNSNPSGASIFLKGEDTSKVTPAELDALAMGDHDIELRKSGFEALSKKFTVSSEEQQQWSPLLKEVVVAKTPEPKTVDLTTSTPVDENQRSSPPTTEEKTATNVKQAAQKTEEANKVAADLKPVKLTVMAHIIEDGLESPRVATVYIDGTRRGQTPYVNELPPGAYTISAKFFGHTLKNGARKINLESGTTEKTVKLEFVKN